MSDAPLRVTRQMFIEEYIRQICKHYPKGDYADPAVLGDLLARVVKSLDARSGEAQWNNYSLPTQDACRALGVECSLNALRALPKE